MNGQRTRRPRQGTNLTPVPVDSYATILHCPHQSLVSCVTSLFIGLAYVCLSLVMFTFAKRHTAADNTVDAATTDTALSNADANGSLVVGSHRNRRAWCRHVFDESRETLEVSLRLNVPSFTTLKRPRVAPVLFLMRQKAGWLPNARRKALMPSGAFNRSMAALKGALALGLIGPPAIAFSYCDIRSQTVHKSNSS